MDADFFNEDFFNDPIYKALIEKYGDAGDIKSIMDAMRKDGFGELIDSVEEEIDLDKFVDENRDKFVEKMKQHTHHSGTISESTEEDESILLDPEGTFKFDQEKCITSCDGKCCKNRGYLQLFRTDNLPFFLFERCNS